MTENAETPKEKKTTKIDDWMVRISFAEAGEADMGFKLTGLDIVRKTKLALDKIMVVRSERAAAQLEGREPEAAVSRKLEGRKKPVDEKVRVMILDDEPIVGKRLEPALAKHGFEVYVFTDPTEALARFD